jgi:hypothetical protein
MTVDLDVVIDSPEYSVEMKSGLKTLQGASDAIRTISETVLSGNIPERKTFKGKVKTLLKASFSGSYGQIFTLDFSDHALKARYGEIGWETFTEVISFFLNDSVYKETERLSEEAKQIIDELGDKAEELSKQLRVSAMKNVHDTSYKFNYDVKIRFRKNRDEQKILAKFDRITGSTLTAKLDRDEMDIACAITRLNINTGNGRLQISGEEETTAFGFGTEYKLIVLKAKKVLSDNLDANNGLEDESRIYLKLRTRALRIRDGKVVKYFISAFYEE